MSDWLLQTATAIVFQPAWIALLWGVILGRMLHRKLRAYLRSTTFIKDWHRQGCYSVVTEGVCWAVTHEDVFLQWMTGCAISATIAWIILWWRKKKRRNALKLAGNKAKAIIESMVRKVRESGPVRLPVPQLPLPQGAGA